MLTPLLWPFGGLLPKGIFLAHSVVEFDVLFAVGAVLKGSKRGDEIPLTGPDRGDLGVGQAGGKGDGDVLFL